MKGQTMLGRGIAAVGIVLALIAIWADYASPFAYWDDGTLGGFLLILAVAAGLCLAGALMTDNRNYDVAVGAIGGLAFGIYLFLPAVFAFDQWDLLDSGAWLGLCSALTFIGAQIATWPTDRPTVRPFVPGVLLALVGLALVIAGLFPDFQSDGAGSYWDVHFGGGGHSFGILLIILVVLEALAIGAAYTMSAGMDSALLLGAVTLGATLAIPVGNAFNQLGDLKAGAWLAAIGGIATMAGALAMWRLAPSEAPAPRAPVATPPP